LVFINVNALKRKAKYELMNYVLYTLIFLDNEESEDTGCLLLTDISSPLPVDIIDVEVEIKLCGSGVLTSLLVLLSFKLRRRTGFLRIRLK
jgi:hypothetical protein